MIDVIDDTAQVVLRNGMEAINLCARNDIRMEKVREAILGDSAKSGSEVAIGGDGALGRSDIFV